jgi:FkbM family methyltransferase
MSLKARIRRAQAVATATLRDPRRRGVNLTFVKPCYWIVDRLNNQSTMLDFGLGFDADFSQAMIAKFGMRSIGFDPTQKHQPALRKIADESGGQFRVVQAAIGGKSGEVEFFESAENVSGSLMSSHRNVQRDTIRKYPVQLITIADAFERAECATPDLVKMDIEGPEYEALDAANDDTLKACRQWVIEFHHESIEEIPFARTRRQIARFESLGFKTYTRDNVNFLFYAP